MSRWWEIGPRVEILWGSFISLSFYMSSFLLYVTAENVHFMHFHALIYKILPIL